jgi:hypothetical protein
MTKYEKSIIRRSEVIDEVFRTFLYCNGSKHLALVLPYYLWEERMLCDVSNHIMTESLKMNPWDVTFNKTDEMTELHSNLTTFIKNKYKHILVDTHRRYIGKTIGHGF